MKIKIEHHFDAAHRLATHKGKCNNLHGHRWDLLIEMDGIIDPITGIVVDFGDIKKAINDVFDHATLLSNHDSNMCLLNVLEDMGSKKLIMHNEPTAENLTKSIWNVLYNHFHKTLEWMSITIWESPTACASYEATCDTLGGDY